jgi:hypothetical protein
MTKVTCDRCVYCWLDGEGYSDYTWMDTSFRCARDLHPDFPAVEPMDWETKGWRVLEHAKECPHFTPRYHAKRVPTVSPDGECDAHAETVGEILRRWSNG